MPDSKLPEPTVIIGRLGKKIDKLQKQRDFYKKRCALYAEVMQLHPHLESRFQDYRKQQAERERVRGLEERVKEQALLIKKLTPKEPQ